MTISMAKTLIYRFTSLDFETIVKEVQLLSEMLTDYMKTAKKVTDTGAQKIEDRGQRSENRITAINDE